jgi:hypothetical protein
VIGSNPGPANPVDGLFGTLLHSFRDTGRVTPDPVQKPAKDAASDQLHEWMLNLGGAPESNVTPLG